uniref:Uncharacterized protein n=1 Tax=Anguilla anguilla TaxID=7936 RepID=A0A0E9PEU3_ANGAN
MKLCSNKLSLFKCVFNICRSNYNFLFLLRCVPLFLFGGNTFAHVLVQRVSL